MKNIYESGVKVEITFIMSMLFLMNKAQNIPFKLAASYVAIYTVSALQFY